MEFEWTITVVGAVLCLLYGWLIGVAARAHGIQNGSIGPVIGVIGMVILAGMAMTGHADVQTPTVADSAYTAEGYPRISRKNDRFENLRSIASRTTQEVGYRPSRNHVAYEDADGNLAWVTKEKYIRLLNKE